MELDCRQAGGWSSSRHGLAHCDLGWHVSGPLSRNRADWGSWGPPEAPTVLPLGCKMGGGCNYVSRHTLSLKETSIPAPLCLGFFSPVESPGPLRWSLLIKKAITTGLATLFQDHPAAGQRHHHPGHHPQPGPGPLVSRGGAPCARPTPLPLEPSLLCPGKQSCIQTDGHPSGGQRPWTPSSRRYKGLAQLV